MTVDSTALLEALKHEDPHDIPDAEKRRIAEEHHEWQTRKEDEK